MPRVACSVLKRPTKRRRRRRIGQGYVDATDALRSSTKKRRAEGAEPWLLSAQLECSATGA